MLHPPRPAGFSLALLLGPTAMAAGSNADPAAPPPADQPAVTETEATDLVESKLALGYLSDPATAPDDIFDALNSGKVHLSNRLRLELADTTARDSSTAITNRIRLGYAPSNRIAGR